MDEPVAELDALVDRMAPGPGEGALAARVRGLR
jgi:hypothetical protein